MNEAHDEIGKLIDLRPGIKFDIEEYLSQTIDSIREKYSKEKEMNIFGTKSDIKMPGDPGYGEVQQEEEKFKRPAYREFLEKIAAAKKGDFG